jgi:hypothetical protein
MTTHTLTISAARVDPRAHRLRDADVCVLTEDVNGGVVDAHPAE